MRRYGVAAVIAVIVVSLVYVSDRLPAQVFRVHVVERDIPKRRVIERASTRVCLAPGELVVQECTFEPRTYRMRFFICTEEDASSGYAEIFLVSRSEARTRDYGRLPLRDLSKSWKQMQVRFEPVDHRGRFFLTIRNSSSSSSGLCLQTVDPNYQWRLPGGMWGGPFDGIDLLPGLGLWNLTAFKYISFRELVYRASQYSPVKGVGILILSGVFFLLLAGCLREWWRLGVPAGRMMVVFVVAGLLLMAYVLFPQGGVFLRSVDLMESEDAVTACDAMLRTRLLGSWADPPGSLMEVKTEISGGFEMAGRVSRLDLASEGIKGWVGLDALPDEGWLYVNDNAPVPLQFGVRHQGDEKGTRTWFDFFSPFPEEQLESQSARLGAVVKVAPGQYFRIPETVLQLGERVPVGQEEMLDMLRSVPAIPVKHPDALPVCGDWDEDGMLDFGYFERQTGRFVLYKDGESSYREFTLGVEGSDWWPAAGDWDGDGRTDVGLYRPAGNLFVQAREPFEKTHEVELKLGEEDAEGGFWRPIAGDWNGDGRDEPGLFQLKTKLFILFSADGSVRERFYYGAAIHSFVPFVGDWCNEGRDRVGLFNVSNRDLIVQSLYGTQLERQKQTGYPLCGRWEEGDRGDTIILLTGLQDGAFAVFFGEERGASH